MKRLLAAALATLMLMSLCCTSALAAPGSDDPTSNTEVPVEITVDMETVHKYFVDIDYPDPLVFTYNSSMEWDHENYRYVETTVGGWSAPQTIKITNHSDMPINYDVDASVTNETYRDLNIAVNGGTGNIAACEPGAQRGSRFAEFTIGVEGRPAEDSKGKQVTLGAIDIAIRP